jgi:hypothetical protein
MFAASGFVPPLKWAFGIKDCITPIVDTSGHSANLRRFPARAEAELAI